MKKILLSLSAIAVVAVVSVSATTALFSDTETSNGNTFAAGSIDLNVDGGNVNVVKFTVTDLVPGSTGGGTYLLANVGNLAGFLDFTGSNVFNFENGCTEPETAVDLTCGTPGAGMGELAALLNVTLFQDLDNDGVLDAGELTIYTGPIAGLVADFDTSIPLAIGASTNIRLNYTLPLAAGNEIQSDSTGFDLAFELGQTAAQ